MLGRAYGIPAVALRFFNTYGPYQALSNPYTGVLSNFASRVLNGNPPLIFEDGLQKRDFVSVYDVARACRLALETPAAGGRRVQHLERRADDRERSGANAPCARSAGATSSRRSRASTAPATSAIASRISRWRKQRARLEAEGDARTGTRRPGRVARRADRDRPRHGSARGTGRAGADGMKRGAQRPVRPARPRIGIRRVVPARRVRARRDRARRPARAGRQRAAHRHLLGGLVHVRRRRLVRVAAPAAGAGRQYPAVLPLHAAVARALCPSSPRRRRPPKRTPISST